MFIAISGMIAAGKTTLARELENSYNFELFEEPTAVNGRYKNEYLEDFYDLLKQRRECTSCMYTSTDKLVSSKLQHVSFAMQMHLLGYRYEMHQNAVWRSKYGSNVVQDRTIWEDQVFAKMLYDDGVITSKDYRTYKQLFTCLSYTLAYPDVILHLDVDPKISYQRAAKRARKGETLTMEYLERLQSYYDRHIKDMKKKANVIVLDWNDDSNVESACKYVFDEVVSNITGIL